MWFEFEMQMQMVSITLDVIWAKDTKFRFVRDRLWGFPEPIQSSRRGSRRLSEDCVYVPPWRTAHQRSEREHSLKKGVKSGEVLETHTVVALS
jgi:hypothetical protein